MIGCHMNTSPYLQKSSKQSRKDRHILVGITLPSVTHLQDCLETAERCLALEVPVGLRLCAFANRSGFVRGTEGLIVLRSSEGFLATLGQSLPSSCVESCLNTNLLVCP